MDGLQVGEGQEGAMTPTERARRSDALYYDTESTSRRCLCDMIANRESDLEELRAEFDKMDKWHSAELQAAMDENAKLRELCADVWHLFTEHGAVHPCDLPVVDAVRDRMRELGVVE